MTINFLECLTFNLFSVPYSVNELYVDDPDKDSGGKIEVSLNISLPNLHCDCEYIQIHNFLPHCIVLCVRALCRSHNQRSY